MNAVRVKDLIALVADGRMRAAIEAILDRPHSLALRLVSKDVFKHPEHDPGCFLHGHEFLDTHRTAYRFALVVFDLEGCGHDELGRIEVEKRVEVLLAENGWKDRSAAVVIHPELEAWVFSDSPHVERVLGWEGRHPSLRQWLTGEGLLAEGEVKPRRPKQAFESAMRKARRAPSAALFGELARHVSLQRCTDPAFLKLSTVLRTWFGSTASQEETW